MSTTVASKNPFELLLQTGEAGDEEVLDLSKSAKKAPLATKPKPAPAAAAPKRDYPQRGGKATIAVPRDASYVALPRRSGGGADEAADRAGARGAANRGPKTSSGRGGRGGFRGRGREFDRHSATGRVDGEKKITQGWGNPVKTYEDGVEKTGASGEEEGAAPVIRETEEVVVVEEEKDNYKTLEEYHAELAAKQTSAAKETRKANEGQEKAFEGAVLLVKEEESFFGGKGDGGKLKSKQKKTKTFLEIEQRFSDEQRRGGYPRGRGGRGGGGGRGRSGYSGVDVGDDHAFPELGA